MCIVPGNQNLTATVAFEDTSKPAQAYHKNLQKIRTHSSVCTRVPR